MRRWLWLACLVLTLASQARATDPLYLQWIQPLDASAFAGYARHIHAYALSGLVPLEAWLFSAGGQAVPCYPGKPCSPNTPQPAPFPRVWFTLNGIRLAGPFAGPPYSASLDTTLWPDGPAILGMEIQSQDDFSYVALPLAVTIANGAIPQTSNIYLPVCPGKFHHRVGQDRGGLCDWVYVENGMVPLDPSPLVPHASAPYSTLPVSDAFYWVDEVEPDDLIALRVEQTVAGHLGIHNKHKYFYSDLHKITSALLDGPRGSASAGALTAGFVAPDGALIAVAAQGRVVRITPDGTITTLAGVRTRQDIPIPYWNDPVLVQSRLEFVGTMVDGPSTLARPRDVIADPLDSQRLYVADTQHHRIVRVDLGQQPPTLTTIAGSLDGTPGLVDALGTAARFAEPWNLAATPDGTLYVSDRLNHAIRRIAPDGLVTTVMQTSVYPPASTIPTNGNDPGQTSNPLPYVVDGTFGLASLIYPEGLRFDSKGYLIVGENYLRYLTQIDLTAQTVSRIVRVPNPTGSNTNTVMVEVNRHATCGPLDDLFVSTTETVYPYRMARDGSRPTRLMKAALGAVGHGRADKVGPTNRYPLLVACGADGALWYSSYINGVLRITPALPTDQMLTAAQVSLLKAGQEVWVRGTVPNFPARQTFALLHGSRGFSHLGNGSFDDLVTVDDATLRTWLQDGWGSASGPRPELTGRDLDNLVYFLRQNCTPCVAQGVNAPLPQSDTVSPGISAMIVESLDSTRARVTWTTDEPAIGVLAYGMTAAVPNASAVESGYTMVHTLDLADLVPGASYQVQVRSKDAAGNQRVSALFPFTMPGG